jgi:hypothetical protein
MYADSCVGRAIQRPAMGYGGFLGFSPNAVTLTSSCLDKGCTEEDTAYLVLLKREQFAVASPAPPVRTRARRGGKPRR